MAENPPTDIGDPLIRANQMDVRSFADEPPLTDDGHSLKLGFVQDLIYPKNRTEVPDTIYKRDVHVQMAEDIVAHIRSSDTPKYKLAVMGNSGLGKSTFAASFIQTESYKLLVPHPTAFSEDNWRAAATFTNDKTSQTSHIHHIFVRVNAKQRAGADQKTRGHHSIIFADYNHLFVITMHQNKLPSDLSMRTNLDDVVITKLHKGKNGVFCCNKKPIDDISRMKNNRAALYALPEHDLCVFHLTHSVNRECHSPPHHKCCFLEIVDNNQSHAASDTLDLSDVGSIAMARVSLMFSSPGKERESEAASKTPSGEKKVLYFFMPFWTLDDLEKALSVIRNSEDNTSSLNLLSHKIVKIGVFTGFKAYGGNPRLVFSSLEEVTITDPIRKSSNTSDIEQYFTALHQRNIDNRFKECDEGFLLSSMKLLGIDKVGTDPDRGEEFFANFNLLTDSHKRVFDSLYCFEPPDASSGLFYWTKMPPKPHLTSRMLLASLMCAVLKRKLRNNDFLVEPISSKFMERVSLTVMSSHSTWKMMESHVVLPVLFSRPKEKCAQNKARRNPAIFDWKPLEDDSVSHSNPFTFGQMTNLLDAPKSYHRMEMDVGREGYAVLLFPLTFEPNIMFRCPTGFPNIDGMMLKCLKCSPESVFLFLFQSTIAQKGHTIILEHLKKTVTGLYETAKEFNMKIKRVILLYVRDKLDQAFHLQPTPPYTGVGSQRGVNFSANVVDVSTK